MYQKVKFKQGESSKNSLEIKAREKNYKGESNEKRTELVGMKLVVIYIKES